jgi:hypothetical protein
MITIVAKSSFDELLISLGAKIVEGRWSLTSLPDAARQFLESGGSIVDGCKYKCWETWYPNIYWVTRDPRCSVSFNTLAKRAKGRVELDSVILGRAQPCRQIRRRGSGHYRIIYRDKIYPTEAALVREFGANYNRYKSRRQRGWSIEESLLGRETEPDHISNDDEEVAYHNFQVSYQNEM